MYEIISGNNPENAREKNIALILQHLLKYNVMSRLQLSKALGLTQASITYIVKKLIEWQVIEETGALHGNSKRPEIGLKLCGKKFSVISVRFNRENLFLENYSFDGIILDSKSIKYNQDISPEVFLDFLSDSIKEIISETEVNRKVLGVGIALPCSGVKNLEGIDFLGTVSYKLENGISDYLSNKFNIPFVLEYEANCGALAEMCCGDELYDNNLVFMNIGRRVNAGIICNGRLYKGKFGKAGDIGHTTVVPDGDYCYCGNKGCLELCCSAEKIVKDYFDLTCNRVSALELLKLTENGDEIAKTILKDAAKHLSCALINLINILNPGTIILSDYVPSVGEMFMEFVKEGIKEKILPEVYDNLNIRMSSEPTSKMIQKGAAMALIINLFKEPTKYFSC